MNRGYDVGKRAGEFVESFYELVGGHAEGDDFGVVDGAEEFLELGEGEEEGEGGGVF